MSTLCIKNISIEGLNIETRVLTQILLVAMTLS